MFQVQEATGNRYLSSIGPLIDQREEVLRFPIITVSKAIGLSHFSAQAESQHEGGGKSGCTLFCMQNATDTVQPSTTPQYRFRKL